MNYLLLRIEDRCDWMLKSLLRGIELETMIRLPSLLLIYLTVEWEGSIRDFLPMFS